MRHRQIHTQTHRGQLMFANLAILEGIMSFWKVVCQVCVNNSLDRSVWTTETRTQLRHRRT